LHRNPVTRELLLERSNRTGPATGIIQGDRGMVPVNEERTAQLKVQKIA